MTLTEKIADEIAAEWLRVPCMPSGDFYDRAWRGIVLGARGRHGREAASAALTIIGRRYNGKVPVSDVDA